jgi:rubrerythrin
MGVTEGIECPSQDGTHFLCVDCFNSHVQREDLKEKNDIMRRGNRIHCPCGSPGRHGTVIPCSAYSDMDLTRALALYTETHANHLLNFAKLERWRLEDVGTGEHWLREQELLSAAKDEKRQRVLMEQSYNDLVLANAIREEDEEAQRRARAQIQATQDRLHREAEATSALIAVTTKPCPHCNTGITHWHGHACHHIKPGGGCPSCHQHFCFACERPSRQQGRWSSPCSCKLFCHEVDMAAHTRVKSGFRYDDRCGCMFCNECAPGRPCALCAGDCVVCQGVVPPNELE